MVGKGDRMCPLHVSVHAMVGGEWGVGEWGCGQALQTALVSQMEAEGSFLWFKMVLRHTLSAGPAHTMHLAGVWHRV